MVDRVIGVLPLEGFATSIKQLFILVP